MVDTEHNARCLSCGESYPASTGVCPHCGAPPVAAATDGSGYRVIVPEIPSAEQRRNLAAALQEALDCVHDVAEMDAQLAKGNVHVICGGLDHEGAQMLAGYLRKLHVSPQVEPDTPAAGGGSRLPVGVALMVLGVVAFFLEFIPWLPRILLGAGALVVGLGLVVWTLIGGAYRRRASLCLPRAGAGGLPGWEAMPGSLSRLLVGLDENNRAALSTVAAGVAHIQDGVAGNTMAGIAAGGPGGALDQAARKLLAGAVATARQIVDEKGDPAERGAALQKLAASAQQARQQFDALGASATAKVSGETPEPVGDASELTAGLAAELEAASKALDEI